MQPINQIARDVAVRAFLQDLIHPEQFGHAVSAEVRQRAKELLQWLTAEPAATPPTP